MTIDMLGEESSPWGRGPMLQLSFARHVPRALCPGDLLYLVCHPCSAHVCPNTYHSCMAPTSLHYQAAQYKRPGRIHKFKQQEVTQVEVCPWVTRSAKETEGNSCHLPGTKVDSQTCQVNDKAEVISGAPEQDQVVNHVLGRVQLNLQCRWTQLKSWDDKVEEKVKLEEAKWGNN